METNTETEKINVNETKTKIIYENGTPPAAFANIDVEAALESILEFFEKSGVQIKPYPKIVFNCVEQKTFLHFCLGTYSPESKTVDVRVTGRSPNDVFRTLFHELIHHSQVLTGVFEKKTEGLTSENSDVGLHPGLTELEEDANGRGFYMYRVWAREQKEKSDNPFYIGK